MTDRRLGLIARADNRGLGQQTWAVFRHLWPAATMVVDCPSQKPLRLRLERFPGAQVVRGFPSLDDFRRFVDGVDVVYTAETGYGLGLWDAADAAGVSTVLHANFEFWDSADRPTVLTAASPWHLGDYPPGTEVLPVPIELDRFSVSSAAAGTARRWLHPVGRPAIKDRNGTLDVLRALELVRSPIWVLITCQESGYVGGLINQYGIRIPDHVELSIDSTDHVNYWTKYVDVDAVVLPRRFGGLCLPANESVGAGVPVVMPDISPNEWLPSEWLVGAREAGTFMAKRMVKYFRCEPAVLADRIDVLSSDRRAYGRAVEQARGLRELWSWDVLIDRYQQCLGSA